MFGDNATHANFSVDNLAEARKFYVEKLGFRLVKEASGQFIVEAGHGTRINIYEKNDHQPWESTVLGIEVDDVASAVQQLKSAGIETAKPAGADADGVVSDPEMGDAAWFRDPASNWICISTILN